MCAQASRARHTDVRSPQCRFAIIHEFCGTPLARRATMRFLYATAFVAALLSAAGCGRTWPSASGLGDPTFLRSGGVRTVAIVTSDVTVAVAPDSDLSPDDVAAGFEAAARAALREELSGRGYRIQPDFAEGAEGEEPGAEPDAVLSLAGFTYAGHDAPSGAEVALGVLMVVLVVGIIAVVLSGSNNHHSHSGGGSGSHGGGVHGARVGHVGGSHGFRGGGFRGFGHGYRSGPDVHIGFYLPPGPMVVEIPSEGPSHALLVLRLVDRKTGRVLWKSQADFPADPRKPGDVTEAVTRLANTLPRAR
jgi:hypothetical protein